jgi:hypothetical protein
MPSSVIHSFSYNDATATLSIFFVSGRAYDYLNVPNTIYQNMKTALSKGTFFNSYIKGKYIFKKVSLP